MKRLLLACLLVVAIATTAAAQTCVVNDPTGTPLNVRTSPNGAWALVVPLGPSK